LESDLKALRLVHKRVVDTSIVFPHRLGPPMKRALRNLASDYLQKIIQEDIEGHDSKEDSSACMQLMLKKVREDLGVKIE
jgi:RNA exonuclease 1